MTKSINELPIADQKRIEPVDKTHKTHHKTKYPPHWEVRDFGIFPTKRLRESHDWEFEPSKTYKNIYTYSSEMRKINEHLKEKKLDEALAIYSKYHPTTSDWPVRFINIQPMPTKREVIK